MDVVVNSLFVAGLIVPPVVVVVMLLVSLLSRGRGEASVPA